MRFASPNHGFQLALVRLPGRMRRALRLFRRITGLTAVSSIATSLPEPGAPFALSPPVHPCCARKLRSVSSAPCGAEWLIHVRSGRRTSLTRSHTCPIGMRCSCVPIHFGDQVVGVAKLVVDFGTPEPTFKSALSVLKLVVSGTHQDSAVTLLSEEVRVLRQRVTELQQLQSKDRPRAAGSQAPSAVPGEVPSDAAHVALVDRALAHLQRHYQEPTLSLRTIAGALGCNPKYLTTRFTEIAGEHLHTYLITLRVSHACGLLLGSDASIKEVAHASGFSGSSRLAGAFRTHVGVSPGEYRRIFASP